MNKVVVCAMTCIALKLVLFIVKKSRNFFFIFYLKKRKIEKELVVGCTELLKMSTNLCSSILQSTGLDAESIETELDHDYFYLLLFYLFICCFCCSFALI